MVQQNPMQPMPQTQTGTRPMTMQLGQPMAQQPSPEQPMNMQQGTMPEPKKSGWLKWLLIILGVVVVVGALFYFKII